MRFILSYEDHIIHSCCQKRFILACFLMSLLANHKGLYFRAKTSFLMLLNFGCYKPKSIRRDLDVYKSMAGENLLMLYLRLSAIK